MHFKTLSSASTRVFNAPFRRQIRDITAKAAQKLTLMNLDYLYQHIGQVLTSKEQHKEANYHGKNTTFLPTDILGQEWNFIKPSYLTKYTFIPQDLQTVATVVFVMDVQCNGDTEINSLTELHN